MALLEVHDLAVQFATPQGWARAVDGVSLRVDVRSTLALVGESGCGKSTIALALLRILPLSARVCGAILWQGQSLLEVHEAHLRGIRGSGIGIVFQEPAACFNPIYSLGSQIAEVVRSHRPLSRRSAWHATLELLQAVQLREPDRVARQYPHEVSGGMQQRVMIAMALAGRPKLLIADEPTTALDMPVQTEILRLLQSLRDEFGMSLLVITHDLDMVSRIADDMAVMYAGKIVEAGPVNRLLRKPLHPYTVALWACRPSFGNGTRLQTIEGNLPFATDYSEGCRFRERCGYRTELCLEGPSLSEIEPGHGVACWHWEQVQRSST